MKLLKSIINGTRKNNSTPISPNTYYTSDESEGVIVKCDDLFEICQGFCGHIENGFGLTVYNIQGDVNEKVLYIMSILKTSKLIHYKCIVSADM